MTTTLVSPPGAAEPARPASVFTLPAFRRLFAAATISQLGTQVSLLALPLVAVTTLHAGAAQVGLLSALGTAAFLLIGLPAGAWVDRMRRRPVMIVADVARAALLASIPLAWAFDALSLVQLDVVVLMCGAATVFFDVANQSYLPELVGRRHLLGANAELVGMQATTGILGRSLAGYLLDLVAAPLAIVIDAVSYLFSALFVRSVRHREATPVVRESAGLVHEIRAGVAFVAGHSVLRAVLISGAIRNFSIQVIVTVLPVLFISSLHLSPAMLGLFLAAGGLGTLAGSRSARRLGARFGNGRAAWLVGLGTAPAALCLPLIDHGAGLWLGMLGWVVCDFTTGVNNVLLVSFRQHVTPEHLQGRMNATMRFVLMGALTVGAVTSGVLGGTVGLRADLVLAAAGMGLAWIPVFCSPMRTTRSL